MASLKEFRTRIASIQSTQKITSAMKMVSGAKLRRAEEAVAKARPYTEHLRRILGYLLNRVGDLENPPALLAGRKIVKTVLFIVFSSDRGLCGSFNANIGREANRAMASCRKKGLQVQIFCVGRKAADSLKGQGIEVREVFVDKLHPQFLLKTAQELTERILSLFRAQEVDEVRLLYNHFYSALNFKFVNYRLIPVEDVFSTTEAIPTLPIIEPSEEEVLSLLLEHNLTMQLYQATLESFASEQGARATAMDSATRNAEDVCARLTLHYNRTRQALITKELTEIVSGAEALGHG
ncbi:MAG: ATP synthase F1 subunit gamma [Holosporales bacterium]|jgi:F-type H+-transporting ATPase subunit gamma|nr:ATP synthase F1 subunit gamma [Holosporales bacterium]